MESIFCKCGNIRRSGQRYCKGCHAAHMRANRPKHKDLNPEQKKRANARSKVKTYVRRGIITKGPCEVCGAKAEAHHEDYNKPLEVTWLCRKHHLEHHKNKIAIK